MPVCCNWVLCMFKNFLMQKLMFENLNFFYHFFYFNFCQETGNFLKDKSTLSSKIHCFTLEIGKYTKDLSQFWDSLNLSFVFHSWFVFDLFPLDALLPQEHFLKQNQLNPPVIEPSEPVFELYETETIGTKAIGLSITEAIGLSITEAIALFGTKAVHSFVTTFIELSKTEATALSETHVLNFLKLKSLNFLKHKFRTFWNWSPWNNQMKQNT